MSHKGLAALRHPSLRSVDESATVDDEFGARNEIGAQQVANGTRDVGWCTDASKRDPVGDAREAGGIAALRW